ncbi:hypothetical protein ACIBCH_19240 [Amycolatopsis thailandensis]
MVVWSTGEDSGRWTSGIFPRHRVSRTVESGWRGTATLAQVRLLALV